MSGPAFKSAHSCRVCGHWSEGDWNKAAQGPEGDAQREKADREMDRGCCDSCASKLAGEPSVTVVEAPAGDPGMAAVQAWFRNGDC